MSKQKIAFTPEQRKRIQGRISDYRKYDKAKFGTCEGSINYSEYLELTIEQGGKCYWTGRDMTISDGLPTDMSLDRLDNSKPHTKDNTILCQRVMNLGRNTSTVTEFVRWLYIMGLLSSELQDELVETGAFVLIADNVGSKRMEFKCFTDEQVRMLLVECLSNQPDVDDHLQLGERIRQFTLRQYKHLGFPPELRKEHMNKEQRQQLRRYDIDAIHILMKIK
jgi:hypothetical protein